jgi:hypothetical protein
MLLVLLVVALVCVKIRQRCWLLDAAGGDGGIRLLLHQRLSENGAARHQLSHLLAVNIPTFYKAKPIFFFFLFFNVYNQINDFYISFPPSNF